MAPAPKAQQEGDLTPTPEGVPLVAFSTDLGVAIWTRTETLAGKLTDQISAIITSPPYPLRQGRETGRLKMGAQREGRMRPKSRRPELPLNLASRDEKRLEPWR